MKRERGKIMWKEVMQEWMKKAMFIEFCAIGLSKRYPWGFRKLRQRVPLNVIEEMESKRYRGKLIGLSAAVVGAAALGLEIKDMELFGWALKDSEQIIVGCMLILGVQIYWGIARWCCFVDQSVVVQPRGQFGEVERRLSVRESKEGVMERTNADIMRNVVAAVLVLCSWCMGLARWLENIG